MAGTRKGGLQASITNKAKHGADWYQKLGRMGGAKSRGGGFKADDRATRLAGAKGGRISRRQKHLPIVDTKLDNSRIINKYKN